MILGTLVERPARAAPHGLGPADPFGGTFVNRFGTFVMPFLAIYMTARRASRRRRRGSPSSSYGAGHILASMLGGHLADRIGRRHTIALSMFALGGDDARAVAGADASAPSSSAPSSSASSRELYRPAAAALLGDLVTPEQRIAAFGMYRFAINLGFAAGPATAGFLADRSFFYVFAGDADRRRSSTASWP